MYGVVCGQNADVGGELLIIYFDRHYTRATDVANSDELSRNRE